MVDELIFDGETNHQTVDVWVCIRMVDSKLLENDDIEYTPVI